MATIQQSERSVSSELQTFEERRKSQRYPVPEQSCEARGKAGDVQFDVELRNVSAGGFGLWSARELPVDFDDEWLLATADGIHQVQLRHVTPQDGGFLIGVERLLDLTDDHVDAPPFRLFGRKTASLVQNPMFVQALVATALMTSVFAAVQYGINSGMGFLTGQASASEGADGGEPGLERNNLTRRANGAADAGGSEGNSAESDDRNDAKADEKTNRDAFTWNDLVTLLELTGDQRQSLLRLLGAPSDRSQPGRLAVPDDVMARLAKTLRKRAASVRAVLTIPQWQQLLEVRARIDKQTAVLQTIKIRAPDARRVFG